jgi:hypothetical protein
MGTSNFARGNASKVYAVLMNVEEKFCECTECNTKYWEFDSEYQEQGETCNTCGNELNHDTEYRAVEEWEIDDFVEYLRETAQEKTKFNYRDLSGYDNERNYGGRYVFQLQADKNFGDVNFDVRLKAIMRGGYYEGANLDFEIEVNDDDEVYEQSFEWEFEMHSDLPKGMQVIQRKNALKWAQKTLETMKEDIESIFTQVSQPLNVVATFSNGETIYAKA